MTTLYWNESNQLNFRAKWPCSDVPREGWAQFDDNGDLVDLSDNTRDCDAGGGLVEFLSDLQDYHQGAEELGFTA